MNGVMTSQLSLKPDLWNWTSCADATIYNHKNKIVGRKDPIHLYYTHIQPYYINITVVL